MKFETKAKIFRGKLDLAPLVDVLFLLLIFFVLSTSFIFQPGHKVSLPKTNSSPMQASDKLVIVVTTDLSGDEYVFYFNNEKVTLEQLEEKLSRELQDRTLVFKNGEKQNTTKAPTVALKADSKVTHDITSKIYDLSYKYKFELLIVTDPIDRKKKAQ